MDDTNDDLKNRNLDEIMKLLKEEYGLKREKLDEIKNMIERGEYDIPIEELVEKILKFLKEKG